MKYTIVNDTDGTFRVHRRGDGSGYTLDHFVILPCAWEAK